MSFSQLWLVLSLLVLFVSVVNTWAQEPATTEKPSIPPVVLSEQHAKLCKVKVGDALPDLEVVRMSRTVPERFEVHGKPITVVFFWQGDGWMTRSALRDLERDIVKPFEKQGVAVLTVAVNQTADETQAVLEKSESELATLLDPEGKSFSQIGSEKLPRIFVIDKNDKIVWFDLEYSHSTRRELRQTVEALTAK